MKQVGIGQAVPRREDLRLLTGHGRFIGDVTPPGTLHACFLRSPWPHAEIFGFDLEAARQMPGVRAVVTGEDVRADGLGDIPCLVPVESRTGEPLPQPGRPLLAGKRVRFVGEPVLMVVADTPDAARDAIERIVVDYQPLPAAATIEDAVAANAPQLWQDAPGNVAFYWQRGDAAAVDAAIRTATHVVRLSLVNNRVVPCTLEPRGAVGEYDPRTGHYRLHTSCQGAHGIKDELARSTLKVDPSRIQVVVGDVGGGFGTKAFHYPEEALVLWAAARLERPVKWMADRYEAFVGDTHGRDQRNHVVAAFDDTGRCLALRVETLANMGAYLNAFAPAVPSRMTGCMLSGVYQIPLIFACCEGIYSNSVPVDAYRGAGRPEATYLVERLMDHAARQLGLSPDEIRRRNFIPRDAMPYHSAAGPTYDTGDFALTLDRALRAADWSGFPARRSAAERRGRLRGIGLSTYIEICGFEAEEATIRFTDQGRVELLIGTQSTGQGHETAYAQIAAQRLGIDFDRIDVIQGDTDRIPCGKGTSGSRSLPVGGPAVVAACDGVLARAEAVARQLLQAGENEIIVSEGLFSTNHAERGMDLFELAAAARVAKNVANPALEATGLYRLEAATFPNGCHVCEVEIDPATGRTEVVAYHVVDDFGTIINPLLLSGQIHGGVAQGIGQALFEDAGYDRATGRPTTTSFADYALPRATDIPDIAPEFLSIPCTTNPLGVKGAGEAGAIAACPAVINAVLDALAPFGITHIDMPATPEKIWHVIRAAVPHGCI